jgi:hypothetical protein
MKYSPTHKSKQFFWLLIKLSIVFGCGYFIWLKLTSNNQLNFSSFYLNLTENNILSTKNLFILLLFSFLNWFLEITKWHTLVGFIKKTTFRSACIQSLASLTTSLITPNRIGEYGAKALYFKKPLRKQILSLNLIGNVHQLLATLFFGFSGLLYFVRNQNIQLNFNKIYSLILIVFTVVLGIFLLWKFNVSKKEIFKNYTVKLSKNQHIRIASLSFLRYLVFAHQFYFLLLLFRMSISYMDAITAIGGLYLISSIIPVISLFDPVLKGSIAVFIFTFFGLNVLNILSITTLMWLLNFVIPASIGSYFVLTFKPKITA